MIHDYNINTPLFRIFHEVYFWHNYKKLSSFLINILNDIAFVFFPFQWQ